MMFVHPVDFDTDRGGHPLLGVLHRETRKQRPGHSQLFAVVIHWTRRWRVIITIPANARTGLILKGSARKFLTVFLLILHLLRISCSLCHSYGLKQFHMHFTPHHLCEILTEHFHIAVYSEPTLFVLQTSSLILVMFCWFLCFVQPNVLKGYVF